MTTITNDATGAGDAARQERSNVLRLAICQALAGANSTVVYATGAVVGDMLAPSKALATMPISLFVVGMALCQRRSDSRPSWRSKSRPLALGSGGYGEGPDRGPRHIRCRD